MRGWIEEGVKDEGWIEEGVKDEGWIEEGVKDLKEKVKEELEIN